jgi:predicted Zn-dependent peptidase
VAPLRLARLRPPVGDRDGLESSTREDLVAFHQHVTNPREGLLLVVGDIDPDRTVARLVARSSALVAAGRFTRSRKRRATRRPAPSWSIARDPSRP